jgi:hypothetical protein
LLSFSLRPFTEEEKEIRKDSISYEDSMGAYQMRKDEGVWTGKETGEDRKEDEGK